jgi:hypothetical protein
MTDDRRRLSMGGRSLDRKQMIDVWAPQADLQTPSGRGP